MLFIEWTIYHLFWAC